MSRRPNIGEILRLEQLLETATRDGMQERRARIRQQLSALKEDNKNSLPLRSDPEAVLRAREIQRLEWLLERATSDSAKAGLLSQLQILRIRHSMPVGMPTTLPGTGPGIFPGTFPGTFKKAKEE